MVDKNIDWAQSRIQGRLRLGSPSGGIFENLKTTLKGDCFIFLETVQKKIQKIGYSPKKLLNQMNK